MTATSPVLVPDRARSPRRSTPGVVAVLGASAVLGIAGDLLFRDSAGPGLNVFVWVAGLAAWATFLSRRYALSRPTPDAWQLPAVLFAAMFALRASEGLLFLDLLALGAALALPLLRARGFALARAGLAAWAHACASLAFHFSLGGVILLAQDMPWQSVRSRSPERTGPIVMGLLLAVPILVVFGSLFAAADPVFERFIDTTFALDLQPLLTHAVLITLMAALAAGYLRARLWAVRPGATGTLAEALAGFTPPRLAFTPIAIATGAMTAMFVLFVAVQARYLFGGAEFVRAAADLSLAEYARRGFFESVAACGLSLPVLLGADWLLDKSDARGVTSFRALVALQGALIGVVLVSALERLRLYTDAFGLTQDRVFGVAGLLWLACVTAWLVATVGRGRRERFAFGAVASGFAVLGALNLANPDALVARVNLARYEASGELDAAYLRRLGPDAAPAIARGLARADDALACDLLASLAARAERAPRRDWRSWSVSRYQAGRAVAALREARPDCVAPR